VAALKPPGCRSGGVREKKNAEGRTKSQKREPGKMRRRARLGRKCQTSTEKRGAVYVPERGAQTIVRNERERGKGR